MRRHLALLEFALASLLRRRGRTAALLLVYTLLVALLGSVLFLTSALRREGAAILADAPELTVQRMVAGRNEPVPEDWIKTIAVFPGVRGVAPRVWGYVYDGLTEATYTVLGIESMPQGLPLLSGRLPAGEGECAIGAGAAEARKVGVGDELILVDALGIGRPLTVTGVFSAESSLLAHDLVLLPHAEAALFLAMPPGVATDLAVRVRNPREVNTVAAKIKRLFPDSRPVTRAEILRTYDAVFDWRGGVAMATVVGVLLAFAILAWDKASGLAPDERREIGILKAVGWDTRDVLTAKAWEGAAVSLLAFLGGTLLAWVHVVWLGAPMFTPVLMGWSVLYPPFRLQPAVGPVEILALLMLTTVPYTAAVLVPSWRAASADPDGMMRS